MSEVKRKLRNSKQADLTGVPEGSQNKKRKSPAAGKGASKKKKHEGETSSPNMVQATVEDLSAAKASTSDAKLVDPNTGEEVQAASDDKPDKASSSKAAAKPKGKSTKVGQLVDPSTGHAIDPAATVESKPAAKPSKDKIVQEEANDSNQPGTSTASAKQEPTSDQEQFVKINRAPVLTLWVAVVAERQGFSKEAGLTFGKAISGMLAQSKGRSIGMLDKKDTDDNAKHEEEEQEHAQGIARHDVFGMSIKAKDVGDEGDVRAVDTNMKVHSYDRHSLLILPLDCAQCCSLQTAPASVCITSQTLTMQTAKKTLIPKFYVIPCSPNQSKSFE
ncbi:TPA: hypothetical protein ACH3X1_007875 [Trebouxia sp. C0004]